MAIPGESMCRPVAECGAPPWGDIPVEPSTQYVDAMYTGGASDGTPARPWLAIQDGIDAASPGAIVAIAEGSYGEAPLIEGKGVRLWGRCPALVDIAAVGLAGIFVRQGATGSEIHNIALRGSGLLVRAAENVAIDQVWIHDAGEALDLDDVDGPVSATLRRSLFERARDFAIFVRGGNIQIEDSLIRDTQPYSDDTNGNGIGAVPGGSGARSDVAVRGSVLERNHTSGVSAVGSNASVEGCVIRDTYPEVATGWFGTGIIVQNESYTSEIGQLTVTGSLVERAADQGIFVGGSQGTVDATRIRDQGPAHPGSPPSAGRGMSAERNPMDFTRSTLVVRDSLIERGCNGGISVGASDATVERSAVVDVLPCPEEQFGRGINVQDDPMNPELSASVAIDASAIEGCHEFGVMVIAGAVRITATHIAHTRAIPDGRFGDGASVYSPDADRLASLSLAGSWVSDSERAGISNFGSFVELAGTRLDCNVIPLNAELAGYTFSDLGGNVCGCGDEGPCKLASQDLAAPTPLP
jgi:hypothetical protein